MISLSDDLFDALRRLRRTPGFAFAAGGVLALGVAATTALFALVHGVVLRPLPYPDPDRLVILYEDAQAPNAHNWPTSVGRIEDYNAASRSLERGVAATRPIDAVMVGEGESADAAERVSGMRATGNLFEVLGVEARMGRTLGERDALPGEAPAVVLGDGLWRRRLGADPNAVGRNVTIDGVARTVVGVMPPGFAWPRPTIEFWIPFVPTESERNRAWFALRPVARLARGASIEAAAAELTAVAVRLDEAYPNTEKNTRPRLVSLRDDLLGETGRSLWLLQGGVLLLLVVAAANFANLLLARGAAREGELAVRSALGGSRGAIVRLQLAEGLVLGGFAALLGVGVGALALRVTLAAAGDALPRAGEVRLDPLVLAVSIVVALAAGALGALVPALVAAATPAASTLRAGRSGSGTRRRQRLLASIVVFEIGVTTTLAVAGALLATSLARLAATDSGVVSEGVVTLEVGQPPGASTALVDQAAYLRRLVRFVREKPGLEQTSALSRLPVIGGAASTGYEVEGRPNELGKAPVADLRWIEPGALELLGVPLDRGRDVADSDDADAPRVVLVNRAFVRAQFPDGSDGADGTGGDAVGKRIWLGNERGQWREIVGVVGDVHFAELEKPVEPTLWAPFPQASFPGALRTSSIVARSPLSAGETLSRLRAAIAEFDPLQAPTKSRTLGEAIGSSLGARRFRAGLFSAFALLAALLAAAGVYGLTAHAVAQRKQELGLRLALGARASTLARHVLGQGARLACVGIALGLVGALAGGRLLASLLYGVRSWEPAPLALVAGGALAVTLVAALAPAMRAARIPPSRALRDL